MCRHLAYLGEPATLRALIADPPHGLQTQAWAPRRQRHGTVNADGFGVGWYADGDPVPARYRRAGPIWTDPSFADLARVTRSRAVLAAVRDASAGTEPGETAAAPYTADRWLFSHNGMLSGWPEAGARLAAGLPPGDLIGLEARCDSAVIWAIVLRRLRAGSGLAGALRGTIGELAARQLVGRFNFLLTDGEAIAATAAGDSLCYRAGPTGVVVASEPSDDEPGWIDVPDQSLVEAAAWSVTVSPIGAANGPGARAATLSRTGSNGAGAGGTNGVSAGGTNGVGTGGTNGVSASGTNDMSEGGAGGTNDVGAGGAVEGRRVAGR